jgi:hypothetical protein
VEKNYISSQLIPPLHVYFFKYNTNLKDRTVSGRYDLWLALWVSRVPQKSLYKRLEIGVSGFKSSLFIIASESSKTNPPFSEFT